MTDSSAAAAQIDPSRPRVRRWCDAARCDGRWGSAPGTAGVSRRRCLNAVALGLVACLGYTARVSVSVAGSHIIPDFALTRGDFGLASAVWAELIGGLLAPVGIRADRIGSRFRRAIAVIVRLLGPGTLTYRQSRLANPQAISLPDGVVLFCEPTGGL